MMNRWESKKKIEMRRIKINIFVPIILFFVITSFAKGTIQNTMIEENGIVIHLKDGIVKIQVCSERTIRVLCYPTRKCIPDESLVIVNDWKPVAFEVQEKIDHIELVTSRLKLQIDRMAGAIGFYNDEGEVLFREDRRQPRIITTAQVLGEKTHHARWNVHFSEKEGIYGLGQHQNGVMNYRGHEVVLTQENTKVAVPFLISTRNYGLLLDNYSKIIFNDSHDSASFQFEVADVIDYYFIAGSDMDDVIRGYREATGQAPMFGKWVFGYWQSKERYKTQEEVLQIVQEYREREIPIDNIIQDWQYWGDDVSQWSSMRFDTSRYPDPELMLRRLHEDFRVHFMISIWPILGSATEINHEMQSKGLLFAPYHWTDGHTYDAYSDEARKIYWHYLNEGLFSKGVDAYWMDGTEPEVFVAPHERSIKSARRNVLGTMARYLNPYSLMTTAGVYQGQRSTTSDKRVFILTRSAFAGQQRNAAATWSGDIVAEWNVLRDQISAGLNFCMSGIPYWTSDIGGFHVRRYGAFQDGCNDPGYRELYVRWFQYGTFNPIFRAHGTDTPREVWRFGESGTWVYDALLKYIHLRYRLLPYIYSLAWRVTNDGYTIMRGLPMDFSSDVKVLEIDDQFMFGPALMINPVTEHMYFGEDYYNETIPEECLFTEDGRAGGFTARYYNGRNMDTLMVDSVLIIPEFDVYLGKDLPSVVHWDRNSMVWSGSVKSKSRGEYELWLTSDDAVRFWFDGTLLVNNWNDQGEDRTYRRNVFLEEETMYKFRIEQARMAEATKLRLAWRTPDMKVQKFDPNTKPGKRSVYLPNHAEWYDFWTGERLSGGQMINRDVPIDIMPIYVRGGSIVPLGPKLQHTDQKPANPLELRIYTGTDAFFELYEDEGDNYNYEKGIYATIPIFWDEKEQMLTIDERKGCFPGMLDERIFHIVWVDENHGLGVELEKRVDRIIKYKGQKLKIKKINSTNSQF